MYVKTCTCKERRNKTDILQILGKINEYLEDKHKSVCAFVVLPN